MISLPNRIRNRFYSALVTLAPAWLSITVGFAALLGAKIPVNGYLWALACLAAGSLLGIVFGVPREPTGSRANTNMEQISDWLTKILVGAGLVEIKGLPHAIDLAAHYVAPSLVTVPPPVQASTVSIAAALIIYFAVEGFLAGFLIARAVFTQTFIELETDPDPLAETRT